MKKGLGAIFFSIGLLLGFRYLNLLFFVGSTGHVQSLILSATLLIIGFQSTAIGMVADLIAANRKLNEEVLLHVRKMDITQTVGSDQPIPRYSFEEKEEMEAIVENMVF